MNAVERPHEDKMIGKFDAAGWMSPTLACRHAHPL